jgi:hypothetical protein
VEYHGLQFSRRSFAKRHVFHRKQLRRQLSRLGIGMYKWAPLVTPQVRNVPPNASKAWDCQLLQDAAVVFRSLQSARLAMVVIFSAH